MERTVYLFSTIILLILIITGGSGCANMMPPTGGPKDSLPPRLLSATPADSSRNVKANRITLTFDEFVELQNATEQLIVSPAQASLPTVDRRLRTVTVRLRDSLEPNTTYTLNFGSSIRDVNEGNIMQDFTYVFSTGSTIDEGTLSGKVILAQDGKVDSTLIVVLHQNLSDTAIKKLRPRYYTRVDGQGNFRFNNLPPNRFAVFAVTNTYFKRYEDSTDMFAFLDNPVQVSDSTAPVMLYAYQEAQKKATAGAIGPTPNTNRATPQDKRLRYNSSLEAGSQDILFPLVLTFNRKITQFDSSLVHLTDTSFRAHQNLTFSFDTTGTKLTITHPWKESTLYKLVLQKAAFADSAGVTLTKTDTLSFATKKEADYGSVKLRFANIDTAKHQVLQLLQGGTVVESIRIVQRDWTRRLYKPGEYELRVLYDRNRNGVWDAGSYSRKLQPEVVKPLDRRLNIKANWDNEVDINL